MPTQQQRSEATRERLISAFRDSMLGAGFEATTMAGVLAQTGLSKGALYHHFVSKTEIVEAIYRAESHGAIRRAVARVEGQLDPINRLKRSCAAWLEEIASPDVARILFDIGPAALGKQRVIDIENELSLRLFEQLIAAAVAQGHIGSVDTALAAGLINAVVAEVAMQRPERREGAARVIGPAVDAILSALAGHGQQEDA